MPVLFVGHGSPMNAIDDNEFSRTWVKLGKALPRPRMILSISAHWCTKGTFVMASERPRTIHDFYGFPEQLFRLRYPAPGSRDLVERVRGLIKSVKVQGEENWGLDHGTWSVLGRMYPQADVPVVQLSLDNDAPASRHYQLGKELARLREEGVLIMGSGNIVHNLFEMVWREGFAYPWAIDFDKEVEGRIASEDHEPLINYQMFGQAARRAIPTNEHYLPMLYVLGASKRGERIDFFNKKVTLGSVGMRGFVIGLERDRPRSSVKGSLP